MTTLGRTLRNGTASFLIGTAVFATQIAQAAQPETGEAESFNLVKNAGVADRIEAGDKLRTMTQILTSAACHIGADVNADEHRVRLDKYITAFDETLAALTDGNESFGFIAPETNSSVINKMNELKATWSVVKPEFQAMLTADAGDAALTRIYENAEAFRTQADLTLVSMQAAHANPAELLQSDMFLIEVSGKQAMSAQSMSYNVCRIFSGTAEESHKEELKVLATQFEFAVKALWQGAPQLGVAPAPTPEVAAALEATLSDWQSVGQQLNAFADGQNATAEQVQALSDALYSKTERMEEVTDLYTIYSRRVY